YGNPLMQALPGFQRHLMKFLSHQVRSPSTQIIQILFIMVQARQLTAELHIMAEDYLNPLMAVIPGQTIQAAYPPFHILRGLLCVPETQARSLRLWVLPDYIKALM